MAKISVIVPVYKVEPYLRCCIDSILAQTFRDFELILVDDGSPDNCGAICDEYAEKDDRIVVIHQENGGLSAARNTGIDWVFANSDSEWITFVDSDDCLERTCLEKLHQYAVETGADITVTGGQIFTDDAEIANFPANIVSVCSTVGKECAYEAFGEGSFFLFFAWGKLYRRELFQNFRYPLGMLYEDAYLTPRILYEAEKVTILRSWLYGYRQRGDSISHTFSSKHFDHVKVVDANVQYFSRKGEFEISDSAKKLRDLRAAKYTIMAISSGTYSQMPREYRIPLMKAIAIASVDTMKNGGIKFVFQRIGNMFRRFSPK